MTELVPDTKAAEILNAAPQTLWNWRHEGRGPKYIRVEGAIRYQLSDLHAYIQERQITPWAYDGKEVS